MSPIRPERLAELRSGRARYAPLRRVAVGGMGEVWRGEAWFPDGFVEEVALKRMRPDIAKQQAYRRMFAEEARIGLLLDHPNVVRLYDVRHRGELILVMEYVEGRSLKQIFDRLCERDARAPVEVALFIAREMARALSYAHAAKDEQNKGLSLIHGDVSPHNVLVSVYGEIKLMDFGLARARDSLAVFDPKKIVGKHAYVAPELLGRRELSQKNDLFSLGVILWELLTGDRLFLGKTPKETLERVLHMPTVDPSTINERVPKAVDRLVSRLLARDPSERYPTAAALLLDLDGLLSRLDETMIVEAAQNLARVHPAVLAADVEDLDASGSDNGLEAFDALRDDINSIHGPRLRRRSGFAARPVLRLSQDELDDFFGGLDTSVYHRPKDAG